MRATFSAAAAKIWTNFYYCNFYPFTFGSTTKNTSVLNLWRFSKFNGHFLNLLSQFPGWSQDQNNGAVAWMKKNHVKIREIVRRFIKRFQKCILKRKRKISNYRKLVKYLVPDKVDDWRVWQPVTGRPGSCPIPSWLCPPYLDPIGPWASLGPGWLWVRWNPYDWSRASPITSSSHDFHESWSFMFHF